MDFYRIKERSLKGGVIEIYPDFRVGRTKDLMVRGGSFYGIWDEGKGMWSTDEYDVQRLVDDDLLNYVEERKKKDDSPVHVKLLRNFSSKMWTEFKQYVKHVPDNAKPLDSDLTFANDNVSKKDYRSKRLPYPLEEGPIDSYNEMIGTLYLPEEREKIEWAVGALIAGDAKKIQKFMVLFGDPGTGKGTIIDILQLLFKGYYNTFDASSLTGKNNEFSTDVFRTNPLLAIQHDGDLSRIEDNTKLNSLVSHEDMTMKEKYKSSYMAKSNAFLFMATNKPVKITDAKSGIIRRLIDVSPSGKKIAPHKYTSLKSQIDFELGAIAYHCLSVYRAKGKNYYNNYKPLNMMLKTDVFFNFVEAHYFIFKDAEHIGLVQAYEMYKVYCEESLVPFKLPRHKFRESLKDYFNIFHDRKRIDGKQVRNIYIDFKHEKFQISEVVEEEPPMSLVIDQLEPMFDEWCKHYTAQPSNQYDKPVKAWSKVTSVLADINTRDLHYIRMPLNHIVIDFDLVDDKGEKSLTLNLEAASKWPATYAELSKSGKGVHLHYYYDGDAEKLANVYSEHIEIKVFKGKSSLRRKFTKCNNLPILKINSGLPLKGGSKKVINFTSVRSEQTLRRLLEENLNKQHHPGTKPSVDFMLKILNDAYESGLKYDVSDMRQKILTFAVNSTNQADVCLKLVSEMPFKSDEPSEPDVDEDADLAFYDVEVFPNLFVVVWKQPGKKPVKLINPSADAIAKILKLNLVGFNCRRYDNHIMYAAYIGYTIEELYKLSQKIVSGNGRNAMFAEAYGLSYTDIYDFSSKKQSLKKFEIELGIHHQELGLPWDQPVPEELWDKVADYCVNDVIATEATFNARQQDFVARQILCDLSGLTPNDSTQKHTAKIIFGNDRNPQSKFIKEDLSIMFPGYIYEYGKSLYKGVDPKEGGYVKSNPGIWGDVALLDVESMHPNSAILMNVFGPYTENYKQILDARLAIKHKDYDIARNMLDGKLAKYLDDKDEADKLSYALKIVINIVYGLTSAKFDNPFRDPRNVDNIVAKRGSLFMIDLDEAVTALGANVVHIKTDSIKISDATQEIIDFVMEFGAKYGYKFDHEATYDKMCLINDAVYIAKYKEKAGMPWDEFATMIEKKKGKRPHPWTATGTQFAVPYTFKTLFTGEEVVFKDLCETKSVKTTMYLDDNESLPDVSVFEKEYETRTKDWSKLKSEPKYNPTLTDMSNNQLLDEIEKGHNYKFVGKVGAFTPIKHGLGGCDLLREKDGKYYTVGGTKGYKWLESEVVEKLNKPSMIDISYYDSLADKAKSEIENYGSFTWFVSDKPYDPVDNEIIPF